MTLQDVLVMEYRLSQRCVEDHDFYEGVRARKNAYNLFRSSELKAQAFLINICSAFVIVQAFTLHIFIVFSKSTEPILNFPQCIMWVRALEFKHRPKGSGKIQRGSKYVSEIARKSLKLGKLMLQKADIQMFQVCLYNDYWGQIMASRRYSFILQAKVFHRKCHQIVKLRKPILRIFKQSHTVYPRIIYLIHKMKL